MPAAASVLVLAAALLTAAQGPAVAAAPAPAVQPIFSIGTPDQSATEFALSPGGFVEYPDRFADDVTYAVGRSTSADWPYIQPGPTDTWAGSRTHTFSIDYTVTPTQAADGGLLQLAFADTSTAPPTVEIASNGTEVDSVKVPAGAGAGAFGRGVVNGLQNTLNTPSQVGFLIPAATLRDGANTIEITTTAGSWAVYDAVTLLPAPATLGAVQVLSMNPTVFFKKGTDDIDAQVVQVGVDNTSGAAGAVTFTAELGGRTETTSLQVPAGRSFQQILTPPAPPPGPAEVDITTSLGGQSATYALNLPYQRRWQVDLINGSHIDNGYHFSQPITRHTLDAYVDQAVDQCHTTADPANGYADNEKFRWTIEGSWLVANYLQDRSAAQVEALARCVRSGQIEVLAGYNNNLQDLAGSEQLIRGLAKGTKDIAGQLGVEVTAAMQNDVTGVSAQYIQMLARQGVKVLINGTNPGHTGANNLVRYAGQDAPTVFNWQAPDGSKVLTFYGQNSYPEAFWAVPGMECALAAMMDSCGRSGPLLPYTPMSPPADLIPIVNGFVAGIGRLLPGLQVGRYPQSVYPLLAFGDTWPPLNGISDVLQQYAEQYSYPRLVMSTPSRYHADATTPPGATSASGFTPDPTSAPATELPVRTGDYTGWWSDGAGSSPVETGDHMRSVVRTTAAETLGSLAGLRAHDPTNACMVDSAYQQQNMWTEHTWGTPSLTYPSEQWPLKKMYADRATRFSTNALTSTTTAFARQIANTSSRPGVAVFNALSWPRTDVVTATVPRGWTGRLQDSSSGAPVPYQAVDATHIQFIASRVPALGYRTYHLRSGSPGSTSADPSLRWKPTTGVLQNRYYRVTVASDGTIASLVDRASGRELVDTSSPFRLNQYVYRPNAWRTSPPWGGAPTSSASQWSPAQATVSVTSSGPVSITIAVAHPDTPGGVDASGRPTGVESAGSTITLFANTPRVDIANTVDKTAVLAPEEGYFAFPFEVDAPTVTYEGTGMPVELGKDQFPGSAMDWQSMQGYADVSNSTGGVTLTSSDAPLVEFGEIKTMRLIARPGRIDGPVVNDLGSVLPDNGSMFSWVFNNLWTTNYNATYPGPMSFHYSITNHAGGFRAPEATRYGAGVRSPLLSAPLAAGQRGSYSAASQSLASLDAPNVTIGTIKQASPTDSSPASPLIVRLLEVAGRSGSVDLRLPFEVRSARLLDLADDVSSATPLTVRGWRDGSKIAIPYGGHDILSVGIQPRKAYDRSAPLVCLTELALAPDGHLDYPQAFPNDVDYTAKQASSGAPEGSYPASTTPWVPYAGTGITPAQWSYIQPGPDDAWAGSRRHTFRLRFDLAEPPSRDLELTLWVLDADRDAPPKLRVSVNQRAAQLHQLAAGGGDGYRWGDGKDVQGGYRIEPRTLRFTLPAERLAAGVNTIALTTVSGSWMVYDGVAVGE